jgi:hypothetical protein
MAIDGDWNLTMNTPMGSREVKANLVQTGGVLGGEFKGDQGSAPVTGTIDGDAVAFKATVNGPMGQMELSFTGALDGDKVSGNVAFGSFGSGTFSGARA